MAQSVSRALGLVAPVPEFNRFVPYLIGDIRARHSGHLVEVDPVGSGSGNVRSYTSFIPAVVDN